MRKNLSILFLFFAVCLLFVCSAPQNPYVPSNATINRQTAFKSLPDTLANFYAYSCSISVELPELVVNYYAYALHDDSETILSSSVVDSSLITFPIMLSDTGLTTIKIVIVKSDKSRDSVSRAFVVYDIIKPSVKLLIDITDTAQNYTTMPITIAALVTDNDRVDSVTFDKQRMKLNGDSATLTVTLADTGFTNHLINAWDMSGNKTTLVFRLHYSGPPVNPPVFKDLSQAKIEDQPFNVLFLDTCVTIPAGASYDTSKLIWTITGQPGGTLNVDYKANIKQVTITPPDSEWNGKEYITFKVEGPGFAVETQAGYEILGVNDPPKVTLGPIGMCAVDTAKVLWLDTCGKDPDDSANTLAWSFTNGKHCTVRRLTTCDSLYKSSLSKTSALPLQGISIPILHFCPFTDRVAIIAPKDSTFVDTVVFKVTDPHAASDSLKIVVTKAKCFIIIPHFP